MALVADKYSFSQLSQKLAAIERLRVLLEGESIAVPGIVVTGNQSAGKSSVLEHISGIQFPRSENTCTKVPTILQMECNPSVQEPFAFVSTKPDFSDKHRVSVDHISAEISKKTEQLTKTGAFIQNAPIHIRLVQNSGPTLSLIDLPGITHVPPPGNKEFDIHNATTAMTKAYIQDKEMVILCVVPALDDFGNCEAIKFAQEVDPSGQRTLGVVTKCDLVPKIEDDTDILQKINMARPDDVKLDLGFYAVCNRSPKEIQDKLPAASLVDKERTVFEEHPVLKRLPRDRICTPHLIEAITGIQEKTVNEYLPKLKSLLQPKLVDAREELQKLKPLCETDEDKFERFLAIVTKVHEELRELVEATSARQAQELHIAPRAYEQMAEFKSNVEKDLPNFLSDEMAKKVTERVKEIRGAQLDNFMSHPIFRGLIVEAFDNSLKNQAVVLMKGMRQLLETVVETLITEHCKEFPRLADALFEEMQNLLQAKEATTREHVEDLIGAESYIFTLNDFYNKLVEHETALSSPSGAACALAADVKKTIEDFLSKSKAPSKTAEDLVSPNVGKMQVSLFAYASVLKTRIYDHLPMVVYRGMILLGTQNFNTCMITKFTGGDMLKGLMDADPAIVAKRRVLQAKVDKFQSAMKEIKDLAASGLMAPVAKL